MYEVAMKIDERIYERQMEKRGGNFYRGNNANTKAKQEVPEWNNNYYGLQKMQLDATQGKLGSKGQKKGQKKSKDNDKIGSGYFPSRRRQSICLTRGMPDHAQTAQNALTQFPTEEIEDWDLLETITQDRESEEDSDEEMEPFNVEFLRGDLVPQLLHKIVAHRQAVFLWKDGQQWVNDTGFTNLMFDLRQMLQGVSVVEGSVNYHMIKVREAKKEYADQAEQQRSRQLARVQALAPRSPREEREDSRQLA
ncbi:hypothetical protein Q7P37_003014 [Cladosporium fusiforme]